MEETAERNRTQKTLEMSLNYRKTIIIDVVCVVNCYTRIISIDIE